MNLEDAARNLRQFENGDLASRLASIEKAFQGCSRQSAQTKCGQLGVSDSALESALVFKAVAGQINVMIHALGILAALPHILEDGEHVESLSLGAGNTGRDFDLETNRRIAEFKFIQWRGGPESIRQNGLFKDFFYLAESKLPKRRYLYLLGLEHPLRFFSGNRALSSVLSKNHQTLTDFERLYRGQFQVVSEYYNFRKDHVLLEDMRPFLPAFLAAADVDLG